MRQTIASIVDKYQISLDLNCGAFPPNGRRMPFFEALAHETDVLLAGSPIAVFMVIFSLREPYKVRVQCRRG
jgi:hypothetical protein